MKKNRSLWMLALILLLSSCANTQATSKTLSMGRIEKNSIIKNKVDRSISLYEMGEVDAAIANLTSLVEDTQYSIALNQAYELLVEWLLQVKRRDQAKRFASFFLKHHPNSPTTQKLVALFSNKSTPPIQPQDAIEQEQVVQEPIASKPNVKDEKPEKTNRIGVLLPLSGQFATFGNRVLAAMKLAWKTTDSSTNNNIIILTKNGVQMVIADSQGDGIVAQTMAEDLIKNHHVALMIGDITSEPTLNVAKICKQYDVPQLSLARHPQILGYDKNVFLFNSSREQQISALVKYAITDKGHKNFAIVFPRHKYGITMAKAFFDEATKQGGKISAMESYEANETTFTTTAKSLVGMHHLDARAEYVACRNAALNEKDRLTQNKMQALCQKEIKPIIDFDAIFIPEFTQLSYLVPALIQEDILVTNNPKAQKNYALATKNDNPKYVQLMGPSSWNDHNIVAKLANQVDGAYFVDSIDFLASNEIKDFAVTFQSLDLGLPTELEVFAHDAAIFALTILTDDTNENKPGVQLRDRIVNFNQKVGLLPSISFDKNQGLIAPVTGFEIIGDTIRVVGHESLNEG